VIVNRATGLNAKPNRSVMATKHPLNERKYINVPVKQKAMQKRFAERQARAS